MSDSQHLMIDCDQCAMQCTSACVDCVVTFVLRETAAADPLELDPQEARVVHLLVNAGLVPKLRYHATCR